MRFLKYHALGNDYLVLSKNEPAQNLSTEKIQLICDRHFGLGSDGILLETAPPLEADFALRIFNPDGSEAEKSGNGLRIFARYLFDKGLASHNPFTIKTLGGIVTCKIHCPDEKIEVEMGPLPSLKEVSLKIKEKFYTFHSLSIGNPHCVIIPPSLPPAKELIQEIGPLIETHPFFPNRTNVQLMNIIDPHNIEIEIWERGAGYTLASGSSASAAAAVAHQLGYCGQEITVHMPGGSLYVQIHNNRIIITGPTTFIGELTINNELFVKKNLHLKEKKY